MSMDKEFRSIVDESLALDRETRGDLVDQLMFSLDDVPTFWDHSDEETTDPEYWLDADEISKIPMSHYVEEHDEAILKAFRLERKANVERVKQKSLGLTIENRILLHRKVLASLRVPDPEFGDWAYSVVKGRMEAYERGEVEMVDGFDALARVRELLRIKMEEKASA
jgi:hypothetical protein